MKHRSHRLKQKKSRSRNSNKSSRKTRSRRMKSSRKTRSRLDIPMSGKGSSEKVAKILGLALVDPNLLAKACGKKPGFFSSKSDKEIYKMCSEMSPSQLDKVISNCLYGAKIGSEGYKLCLSGIGKGSFGVKEKRTSSPEDFFGFER
jgi:hypothetical protein